jgi:hypothetical protein
MKYTIAGFQQSVLLAYGLGVDEAEILRLIVDFWFSKKMETRIIEGREYFYLSYNFVANELPILGIDRRQVANKLQKFVACGLFFYRAERSGSGTKVFFSIDEDFYIPLVEIPGPEATKPEKKAGVMDPAKAERGEAKDYFFWLYLIKAGEITGSEFTAEGKSKNPMWGAKEASLLLKDYQQFGLVGLKRFMRLFFSDTVYDISQFTRYRTKAGYGYGVFHGSLAKLSVLDNDISEPCRNCGKWFGHATSCKVEVDHIARIKNDEDDALRYRTEHPEEYDVDLVGLLESGIRDRANAKARSPGGLPPTDGGLPLG